MGPLDLLRVQGEEQGQERRPLSGVQERFPVEAADKVLDLGEDAEADRDAVAGRSARATSGFSELWSVSSRVRRCRGADLLERPLDLLQMLSEQCNVSDMRGKHSKLRTEAVQDFRKGAEAY